MKFKLTQEQQDWIHTKLQDKNILCLTVHGSHLYGLNREGSDIDLKAVYLPTGHALVRGEALKTYNHKNDDLDIEIEVKSISSFLRSASSCDTNCLDMLHTQADMTLITTPLWEEIKSHRKSLYAKNMKGIIGYIKTQSVKYSHKIERLTEMKSLLTYTENYSEEDVLFTFNKVGDVGVSLKSHGYKYIKCVTKVPSGVQPYLEVCGKKYCLSWDVSKLVDALKVEINRYGERSNKGASKGIDSKSLSHSLRVLVQLKEILVTGDLEFPLKEAKYVKAVKLGEITDLDEVLRVIDDMFDECMILLESSDLQEEVDTSSMEYLVQDYYFN